MATKKDVIIEIILWVLLVMVVVFVACAWKQIFMFLALIVNLLLALLLVILSAIFVIYIISVFIARTT
jgi:hypothetical protein